MADFPRQSLIEQAKQQPSLFGVGSESMDAALFAAEESSRNPEFTGARLFAKKPETYQAIVALSAEGLGALRIARILGVSANTVCAVRAREPAAVDAEKKRIADLSRAAARMCVDRICESLSDPEAVARISVKDLGIVAGILIEKAELLSGGATARLETHGTTASVDVVEYLRWIQDEYARRMGSGAEKEGQRALAGGSVAGGGAADVGADGTDVGASGPADSQPCETPINIDSNEGGENIIRAISPNP